jgi:hypothetical protein
MALNQNLKTIHQTHIVTCCLNTFAGKPLVSGSANIELVLMCSILMVRFWHLSFTTRYLRSICLEAPLDLLLLEKNTAD